MVTVSEIAPLDERKYDIIVIGATGFTGSLVTRHLSTNAPGITWAVAGRSKKKLDDLIASLELGDGVKAPDVIVMDVLKEDEDKLREMMSTTRLVIDVVGPYSYYGEKLLKPCVEAGTAWVDLNGEIPWVKDMIDKYHKLAQETGAVVIPSCGFDCIPSDLGVFLLSRFAGGPLGTVDTVMEEIKGGYSFGTLSSFVAPYKIYPASWIVPSTGYLGHPFFIYPHTVSPDQQPLPKQPHRAMIKPASRSIFYSSGLTHAPPAGVEKKKKWGGNLISSNPMEAINRPVVMRSYGLRSSIDSEGKRSNDSYGPDFKYREWVLAPSGPLVKIIEVPMTYFLNYGLPYIMVVPWFRDMIGWGITKLTGEGYGPTKEMQERGGFRIRISGEVVGHVPPQEKAVVVLNAARDPGYGWTGIILAETALHILSKLRGDGLVQPPKGSIGGSTPDVIERLVREGKERGDDVVFGDGEQKGGFWTTASLGMGLLERLLCTGYMYMEAGWVVDKDYVEPKEHKKRK